MKAAWYEKTGEAQTVLQIGELDNPVPNEGEVLVQLKTSGINPSDVKTRAGARGELQFPKIIPHSDGAGTKSIVGYLQYKELGDPKVFRGIAQDSIVMNLDDLICSGARSSILISTTINRNAMNCPQEVIRELIFGTEDFLESMRCLGINIHSGGGETADVGDCLLYTSDAADE